MTSTQKSFTIYAYNFEQKRSWVEALRKLSKIESMWCKIIYFYLFLLAIFVFIIARDSPIWMDDSDAAYCLVCSSKFTLTNRKVNI